MYLPFPDFSERYPLTAEPIGRGGYSEVYLSGEHAVKKGRFEDVLMDLVILSQVSHGGLVRAYHYTDDTEGNLYIALDLGDRERPQEYVARMVAAGDRQGVCQFVYRLTCAVTALHGVGIVHGDIKPPNLIIRDGRPVLIDFGLSQFALPSDDDLHFNGHAYTDYFRSPLVNADEYNSVRADLFALGKTIMALLLGQSDVKATLAGPFYDNFDPQLAALIRRLTDPEDDSTAVDLLEDPYFDGVESGCSKATLWLDRVEASGALSSEVVSLVLQRAAQERMQARTLFATLHNVQRYSQEITPELAEALLALSLLVFEQRTLPEVSRLQLLEALRSVNGEFNYRTLWDRARSPEEVAYFLEVTSSQDYSYTPESGEEIILAARKNLLYGTSDYIDPSLEPDVSSALERLEESGIQGVWSLSDVWTIRELMVRDASLANWILQSVSEDIDDEVFDVLYGNEKLDLVHGRKLNNLPGNAYTLPVDELAALLS